MCSISIMRGIFNIQNNNKYTNITLLEKLIQIPFMQSGQNITLTRMKRYSACTLKIGFKQNNYLASDFEHHPV